jgi:hypothetical protein
MSLTDNMMIIINADDFGLNESCTKAIMEAFSRNLISSSTVCSNGPYYDEARDFIKEHGREEQIGIHFNLTEGWPLTEKIRSWRTFCNQKGMFHNQINRLKPLSKDETLAVSLELSAQLELMQRDGLPVTHADSHHHIHTAIFLAPIVLNVLTKYHISKVRIHHNMGTISQEKRILKWLFNSYLQFKGFTITNLLGSFRDLPTIPSHLRHRWLELVVHPEYDPGGKLVDRFHNEGITENPSLEDEVNSLGVLRRYSFHDLLIFK